MSEVRVATFNIRHGLGHDRYIDLERTAAAIVDTRAGLIALQEVDRNLARSGRVDQPRALGEMTGLQVWFHATIARGGGWYGIALAASELGEPRYEELPRLDPEEEPRGAIVARWREVSIVATHLSLVGATRALQIETLATIADGLAPPVVVMGDLNQERDGLEPLTRRGYRDDGRRLQTFRPGARRGRQLDYVLAGPGATVARTGTVASHASDHVPLVAELVLDRVPPG
jgi:endonuclease/exonuclease/phosphatase family metal-dependent hydrolase